MAEGIFEPLRVLAELNALGVPYVLVGDLAAAEPSSRLASDRVEICVANDDDAIDRLRMLLEVLDAEQDEATDDPHLAAFRTAAGRLECREMATNGEFAELEARATLTNFGRGVMARVAAPEEVAAERPASHDLVGAVSAASLGEHRPRLRRFRREDEDEFGTELALRPGERMTPWRRVWKAFENVDDFLSDLNERSVRRPRDR